MPVVINPAGDQPEYNRETSDFDPYNVYVKNLPFDLSEDELGNLFHGFGEIKNLRIMKDPVNGRSLGFGFVRYRLRDDAQSAINQMDGTQVGGRAIQCRHAGQSKFYGAGKAEGSRAVHVRPLPPAFTVEDLRRLVEYYGEIEQISILTNPDGTSRGVGFVKFMDPSAAQRVATELNTTANGWDKQITAKMVENNPLEARRGSSRAVTTIDTGVFFEGANKNVQQNQGGGNYGGNDGGNWRGGGGGASGWRGGRGGRGQGGWGGGGRGGWQGGSGGQGGGNGNDGWGGDASGGQGQGGWNQGGNYQGGGDYSQQGGNYNNAQQGNYNQGGQNYNQQQQQWGNQGGYNQGGGDGSWNAAQQGGLAAVNSNFSDRRNSGYTSGGDSGSERAKTTFVNPNFVPKPQNVPAVAPSEGYDDYSHSTASYDNQGSGQYQGNSNYSGGYNNNYNPGGYQSGGNQGGYNQNYNQGNNNQWGQNQNFGQNYGGGDGNWQGGGGGGKMGGRGGYGGDFGERGRGRGGGRGGRFAPYGGPPGSGSMGPPEDLTNVFIFHLPLDMDENGLRNMYSQYGNVESVKVMMDRETGISRGFGFVKFTTPQEAQNAITQTDGMKMAGKFLSVSLKSKK